MSADLKVLEITGAEAVKRLRKRKLAAGKPFMINAKDLPVKQSYLEYPDNTISLVTIAEDQHSFTVLRNLSGNEATAIRLRFNLI